jgi:rsbT co-antagonist protein RsbR
MQFTLTKKVAVSALICFIFIAAAAAIALISNLTMRDTVRELSEHTTRQVAVNGQLNYQLARAIAKAQVFYYSRKDTDRLDAQRLFRDVQAYETSLASDGAKPGLLDPQLVAEHVALLERRQALVERAQSEFAALVQADKDSKDLAARRSIVSLIQTDRDSGQLTDDLNAILDREAAAVSTEIDTLIWRGQFAIGLAFGLIALLIPLILFLLQRKIVQPIKRLSASQGLVASGDLTQLVTVTSADEIGQLQRGFNQMLDNLQGQRDQLTQHKDTLQARAAELEQTLAALRESVDERDQLSNSIRELSSPVIPVLDGVLIMPLIGAIDSERATLLVTALLSAIEQHHAMIVLMDVTGVPLVDTQVARVLLQAADAARLLGAEPILVGIRPELAQTIVGLGLDLSSLKTQADLQSGIRYATQRQSLRRQRLLA